MIRELDKEDEYLRNKLTNAPNNQLNEPSLQIHKVIWVDIVIVDWHIFVRIKATF